MNPREVWQVFKIPLVLGSISLLCIVLSISIFIKSYQSDTPITFSNVATVSGLMVANQITVDIEGAVKNPGVYKMPFDSRVEDVIEMAKGLSNDADTEKIAQTLNRAAKVVDGGKIFIPRLGEVSNSSPISDVVSINNATQSQLEALPGIGPVTAEKIIGGRPYQTLEELVQRKILSTSVFEKSKLLMGL